MEAEWKKYMRVTDLKVQREQRLEAERLRNIEKADSKKARADEEFYLLNNIGKEHLFEKTPRV